jgi:hypothetical protein
LPARSNEEEGDQKGCLGGFSGWCEFLGEVGVLFIGSGGQARWWPGRGLGMAVTGCSASSSGRHGRGGAGVLCGYCGDARDAQTRQDDERTGRGAWLSGGDRRRLSRSPFVGSWHREVGDGRRHA